MSHTGWRGHTRATIIRVRSKRKLAGNVSDTQHLDWEMARMQVKRFLTS